MNKAMVVGGVLVSMALPLLADGPPSLTTLYSFRGPPDGAVPLKNMLERAGLLYALTWGGGAWNGGAIVQVDPNSSAETVLYSFGQGTDGSSPFSELVTRDGVLYGATQYGGTGGFPGSGGYGTVFAFNLSTHIETVLHDFVGGSDGTAPDGITIHDGYIYGTTLNGGTYGQGTVFMMGPTTGQEKVLYSFAGGTDGSNPEGIVYCGDALYGIALNAGANNAGMIFRIDLTTHIESVVYSFGAGSDAAFPRPMICHDAVLYGNSFGGGDWSRGTVFKYDLSTGQESVLHSFGSGATSDGIEPQYRPLYHNGSLYGTTQGGGAFGAGAVFVVDASTGAESLLYSFTGGLDGQYPYAQPLYRAGFIYGTTAEGGTSGNGTVFKVGLPPN